MSAAKKVIHPTLHHYGLTTANLGAMKDWYAKVLGMTTNHETPAPDGAAALPPTRACWVTNDGANHRIGIIALPGLTADAERARHHRLQHVAFELPTIDPKMPVFRNCLRVTSSSISVARCRVAFDKIVRSRVASTGFCRKS